MSSHCCEHELPNAASIANMARYRRILWIALIINAAMFFVEVAAGHRSGSVSLLADAIDFAGDALNYGVSLAVLSAALVWRSRAALAKAICMLAFGSFVLAKAVWVIASGGLPDPLTMGVVGLIALTANLAVTWMLYAYREGDANMRSVWLCSRNDAIGNLAVIGAALGVFGSATAWPDLIVAAVMAGLALYAGGQVLRQARAELRAELRKDSGHAHAR